MDSAAPYSLVLPSEYLYILLACVIICIECFLTGIFFVAPARFGIMNKEHMTQFKEMHEQAFPGSEPAPGGFPDCGEGRYAEKLSYADWVKFNNAMRVHQNFIEQLPITLTFLMFSGLFLPKLTMIVGFVYVVARPIYSI